MDGSEEPEVNQEFAGPLYPRDFVYLCYVCRSSEAMRILSITQSMSLCDLQGSALERGKKLTTGKSAIVLPRMDQCGDSKYIGRREYRRSLKVKS